MLSQQHSQLNNTRSKFQSPEESPNSLSNKKIPEYFEVSGDYETMTVGNKFSPYRVVNVPDYDCYVLAGIEENELFSKLIMMNMNIDQGIAFDANSQKISHHFPTNIQVINKRVSFKSDEFHENLSDMGPNKDVFLKMNVYGEEYIWALSLTKESLLRFKQMVIVFHDINNNPTQQRALNKIKCFQKLKKTHDVANINPVGDNLIVTYFRKEKVDDEISVKTDIVEKESVQDKDFNSLKLALQNTVKEMVKNVEKEIIQTVSTSLKTEFDNEIEKIMKDFKQNKEEFSPEKLNTNISQRFEMTQERVKEFVKDIDSKLAATVKMEEEDDDDSIKVLGDTEVESVFETEKENTVSEKIEDEKVEMSKEDKEEEDTTPKFSLNKPTFSPVEKPFSPEPAELKGRNAKKNAKKAAKKAAKKTVVLDDLKEDSAEDKESSSSASPDKESIQDQTEQDETIEDIVHDDQAEVEEVSMIIDNED